MLPRCAQIFLWLSFAFLLITIQSKCTAFETDYQEILFNEVIEGEVECENFTYYIVDDSDDSVITLNLTSLSGDCDLYISQARHPGENPPNPTVETYSYDLQSTTCGQDVITISREISRPFAIGIYAHPSYNLCMYRLEITGTRVEEKEPENELEWSEHHQSNDVPSQESSFTASKHQHKQSRQKSERSTAKGNSDYDSFIELLINIAIQFLGFLFEIIV